MSRRREIIDILQKEEHSACELARLFRTRPDAVLRDLVHIEKSLKAERKRLSIRMPYCKNCGFVFKLKEPRSPSKCPNCRSEWMEDPRFKVICL
jgi:hypothetical protein